MEEFVETGFEKKYLLARCVLRDLLVLDLIVNIGQSNPDCNNSGLSYLNVRIGMSKLDWKNLSKLDLKNGYFSLCYMHINLN